MLIKMSPRYNKRIKSASFNSRTSGHQTSIQRDVRLPKRSVQALYTTKILSTYVQYL